MARKLRVEYPGAIYHLMNRGDRREPIFRDDEDRECFLATLGQACAKTGWQGRVEPQIGWWVGWVERPEGPVFFALNIDMPAGGQDAPKRESIARAVLRSIKALPPAD